MTDSAIALLGTDKKPGERIALHAGPVTATFDDGWLRRVMVDGREVLRAVVFLVRDSTWGTAKAELSNLKIDQRDDGFSLSFDVHCTTKDGAIDWRGRIEGEPDGALRFEGVTTPREDFTTSRTGFVVLHPLEGVVGRPVRVGYVDGSSEDSRFPELIDPYQNFKNFRSLSTEALPDVWATCAMEGDAWEMEDHRNWTDASFKSYVRLLEWGFPYTLTAGEEVRQSVVLTLSGAGVGKLGQSRSEPEPATIRVGEVRGGAMPKIGMSLPAGRLDEAEQVAPRVRPVAPAFLHCRMNPAEDSAALLTRYRDIAAEIGSPIAVEITVSNAEQPEADLQAAAEAIQEAGVEPAAVIAVPATTLTQLNPMQNADLAALERIPHAARSIFPGAELGGGVFGFFTELNRNRPPTAPLDFLTHITTALVHHEDDASVMETVAAVQDVIRSTRAMSGGKAHWLGPANIAMDENPYGEPTPNPENDRVTMARMDPRQRGLFGAAWLVGYLANATEEGVDTFISGAPAGELGLVYSRTDYHQPYYDGLAHDAVYPIYHVMRVASAAAGKPLVEVSSNAPERVAAFCYREGGGDRLWLANLTAEPQTVELPSPFRNEARLRVLDESRFEEAARDPDFFDGDDAAQSGPSLELGAYAVARITSRG